MTLENTAWAIDGALLNSSLARRAEYAAVSGAQGIVQSGDLKVTQLGVPGVGVQIAPGVGLVTNAYQDIPNETYVVSNPDVHTIPSGEMPSANPSTKHYIVAIVVGDPDFSQTGHPWMGSDDPPEGEEQTFEYVRATLIEVSAGVETLPADYPALPLARLDIPPSTTTITNSMIVDLRSLARPRQSSDVKVSPSGTWTSGSPVYIAAGSTYTNWGSSQFAPTIRVPSWATRAILIARVNSAIVLDTSLDISGIIRAQMGSLNTSGANFDLFAGSGDARMSLEAAGEIDVTSIAGTEVVLRVQGYQNVPASPHTDRRPRLVSGSQFIFDVRFFEE